MESAEAKGIRCAGTAIGMVRECDARIIIDDLTREYELICASFALLAQARTRFGECKR